MAHFFTNRLISQDRVHRHYAYLLAIISTLTVLFMLMKPFTTPPMPFAVPLVTWGSPLCSVWTALVLVLVTSQTIAEHEKRHGVSELLKFLSQVALMLVVPVFYEGSNVVQRYRYSLFEDRMLYDSHLLRFDEAVLGWLCPRGQLALCLDSHPLLGVKTLAGMVLAEVLQCMYVSYYFWGNGLGVWLAYRYFVSTQLLGQHNSVGARRRQWRRIQMFCTAWVGGFLCNFILNLLFPAVSPRIHLHKSYVNEIQGVLFANSLRSAIQGAAANTFSAFPSGHCGLSWLVPLFAHRMGYMRFRLVTIVAAVLISSATLILRYHYFADMIFSAIVVAFAAWFGGFHTAACYEECVVGDEREHEKDKKGRRYEEQHDMGGAEPDDEEETSIRVPLMEVKVERGGAAAPGGGAGQTTGTSINGSVQNGVLPQLTSTGENGGPAAAATPRDDEDKDHATELPHMPDAIRLTSTSAVISRQTSGSADKLQPTSRD